MTSTGEPLIPHPSPNPNPNPNPNANANANPKPNPNPNANADPHPNPDPDPDLNPNPDLSQVTTEGGEGRGSEAGSPGVTPTRDGRELGWSNPSLR